MRASGTYFRIVDESFTSSDNISLTIIMPMMLQKGNRVEVVTLANLEKKVGYDLTYNPRYLGLKNLLASVARVTLFRMNKNAMVGNLVFPRTAGTPGTPAIPAVPAVPEVPGVAAEIEIQITNPTSSAITIPAGTYTLAVDGGSQTYSFSFASDTDVVEDGGDVTVSAVSSVEGVDHEIAEGAVDLASITPAIGVGLTVEITAIVQGTDYDPEVPEVPEVPAVPPTVNSPTTFANCPDVDSFFAKEMTSDQALGVVLNTPGVWSNLGLSVRRGLLSNDYASDVSIELGQGVLDSSLKIYDATGVLVATETAGVITEFEGSGINGTVDLSTGIVTLDEALETRTTRIDFVPSNTLNQTWFVTLWELSEDGDSIIEDVEFSYNPDSPIYWQRVQPVEFTLRINVPIQAEFNPDDPYPVLSGSNGIVPFAADLNLKPLADKEGFFVCMNGVHDIGIINLFSEFTTKYDKMMIGDTPNFPTYEEAYAWTLMLPASRDLAITSVSEQVQTEIGILSVAPSIKVMQYYARIFKATGRIFDPPAGYIYGGITAEALFSTDFVDYGDELKTNKINYLKIGSQGPVIWEQRTRQAQESDLSYIHANVILKHFAKRLFQFGEQFNFMLIGPAQLTMMTAGIQEICDDYVTNDWLWAAAPHVPSWSDVMANGVRVMDIPIAIKIAEDSEERTFVLRVKKNATDVS